MFLHAKGRFVGSLHFARASFSRCVKWFTNSLKLYKILCNWCFKKIHLNIAPPKRYNSVQQKCNYAIVVVAPLAGFVHAVAQAQLLRLLVESALPVPDVFIIVLCAFLYIRANTHRQIIVCMFVHILQQQLLMCSIHFELKNPKKKLK